MTAIEAISVLIIRLWAAGIFLTYLSAFGYWVWEAASGEGEQKLADLLVEAAVWLTPALVAFAFAARLSKLIAPRAAPEAIKFDVTVEEIVSAGTFLIGLFFMLQFTPQLILAIIEIVSELVVRDDNAPVTVQSFTFQRLFAAAMTFAAALFLTFRPREIGRLISSLRHAGLPKVEQAD
ncbi:MAG: hypothetical protein U5J99_10920 [Parvularculaceae bacterium]|nr:hypothetical protein [Parvularculaceae bacterium]